MYLVWLHQPYCVDGAPQMWGPADRSPSHSLRARCSHKHWHRRGIAIVIAIIIVVVIVLVFVIFFSRPHPFLSCVYPHIVSSLSCPSLPFVSLLFDSFFFTPLLVLHHFRCILILVVCVRSCITSVDMWALQRCRCRTNSPLG